MNKLVTILLLIGMWTNVAYGWGDDQLVTDAGLGILGSRGSSLSQDKFAKIGVQEELVGPFNERFNVGGWEDSRGVGYTSAAFGGYQVGYEVSNDIFQSSIWTGPSLITSTDGNLGGVLQFNETIFFGIVNKDHDSIGIAYNHFSSAGIEMPNFGRDYIGLEIKFPF